MTRPRSTKRAPLLALAALAWCAGTARADELVLTSGESLTGKVQGERLAIETPQGRIEAPFEALSSVELDEAANARVTLVDGTVIEGRWVQAEIVLRQGLLDRVVPAPSIRRLVWSPPAVTLPSGTPVPLALVRSVSSAANSAGDPVSLCTTEEVTVNGKVVIARHSPASGSVLGTGGGSNVGGGGTLVLRAGAVLARDGSSIPLAGNLQVRGGFNGANWGLAGLLSEGSPALAASGTQVEAKTASEAAIGLAASSFTAEQLAGQELCADFFRFSDSAEIGLEKVVPGRSYAPVPQPLKLSLPLLPFAPLLTEDGKGTVKTYGTRPFSIDGVALASLTVEAVGKGKRGATFKITAPLTVPASYDRWVSLTIELLAGEKQLQVLRLQRIDAEERKVTPIDARLTLSRAEVDELLAAPNARLRITMTAIEN
ncbi:MAG: hypothetical protein IPJ17_15765 [Holophagales bacterium]|nr:MAG: hypothetical protein IPJ17_15765 [Holophagales bacterium]